MLKKRFSSKHKTLAAHCRLKIETLGLKMILHRVQKVTVFYLPGGSRSSDESDENSVFGALSPPLEQQIISQA